jgi:hypothetical protein
MIGVGVIKTNNILATLAPFALDAYQFARVDAIAILRRIRARVAAAHG